MDLGLTGASVLITGGSKGIGAAAARAFAAEGCNLCLVARDRTALEAIQSELTSKHSTRVDINPADLSRSESVAALASRWPDIDVLVNNAGAIPGGDLDAIDEARWRAAWDLKVFGYINMTRAFLSLMAKRGRGVIVNVIGLAGELPSYDYVCGSAGNAALMAFTRAVGGRSVDRGVRVVAVNPALTETERLVTLTRTRAAERLGDPERWRELLTDLPFGRPASADDIAAMVVFLASPRCGYVSGSVVSVDAGTSSRR